MALVVQAEVFTGILRPFQTQLAQEERARSSEPFGICTFSESFTVDAIGAGDSGRLDMRFDLPANFCYLLRGFNVGIRDGTTKATTWLNGLMQTVFQAQPGDPSTIVTQWPLGRAEITVVSTSVEDVVYSAFGGLHSGSADYVRSQPPNFIQYGRGADALSPHVLLLNLTASTGSWPCAVLVQYLAYTIEQAHNSALYWALPPALLTV